MNHKKTLIAVLCLFAFVLVMAGCAIASDEPAGVPEQEQKNPPMWKRLTIRPVASMFMPSDSKTQDRFGDSWGIIGISIGMKGEAAFREGLGLKLDFISGKKGSDQALLIPIGLYYHQALSRSENLNTYAGVGANVYLADIRSSMDNVDTGLKTAIGASAVFGVDIGNHLGVEASYYLTSSVEGFDLGGLNLTASWRF